MGGETYRFEALPRALPLLAYLILERARPIYLDALATLFWPDDRESDARVKLRRHLQVLEVALPPAERPWIVVTSDALQWNLDADATCDVVAFEQNASRVATYEDAVVAYGGDFLVGYTDAWIIGERKRLERIYLYRREALMTLAVDDGRTHDTIRHARAILTTDPWRESAVRALMRARAESGDLAGAAAEYDRFAQQARRERESEPTLETRTLLHELIGEREAEPPRSFAGRDEPLRVLGERYEAARSGRGSVVFLTGDTASGNTEFAEAFADRVVDARVFVGRTSDPESQPYEALAGALRAASGLYAHADGRIAALAALLPDVGHAMPRTHATSVDRERRRLYDAIAVAFVTLAHDRPFILVLPEFHRAGEATVAALDMLARRIVDLPVLVIATFADGGVPERLALVNRGLREVNLATILSVEPLATLIDRRRAQSRDDSPAPALTRAEANARARGMQFERDGDDERAAQSYVRAAARAIELFADADAQAIVARALLLARTNATRFALFAQQERIIWATGNREDEARILDVLERHAEGGYERAEVLKRRLRFARRTADRREHERLVDAFSLLATELADDVLIMEAALASGQGARDSEKFSAARVALLDAADRALALNAVDLACETLLTLAEMEATLGNAAAAHDFLKRADREAEHAGDLLGRARMVNMLITMLLKDMRMSEAIAVAEGAQALFAALGDREMQADIDTQVARAHTRIGHFEVALGIYAEAATVYRQLDVPTGEAKTLINSAIALMRLGRYDEALANTRAAAAVFDTLGDARGRAVCGNNAGLIAYYRHRYGDAVVEYERALSVAESIEAEDLVSNILSNLGAAHGALGNYERAIDLLERGIRLATARDRVLAVVNDIPDLVLAYVRIGDARRAEMTARTMLEVVARLSDPYDEMYYVEYVAGLVDDRRSRLSSARTHYATAERLFQERIASFTDEGSRAAFLDLPNSRLIREGLHLR